MLTPNIEITDEKSFASAVADEIVLSINDSLSENDKCVIALAGGSTPSAIYRLLGMPPRVKEINWKKVILLLGDERYVPHDSMQSNYRMIEETLLSSIKIPEENILTVNVDLGSVEKTAKDYQEKIIKNVNSAKSGIPAIDIVLLGMGEDGHTASLFPNSSALKSNEICCAVSRPDGLQAISLTFNPIMQAKNVIFMVKGSGKAEVLKQVLEGRPELNQYPASIFKQCTGKITWFVDSQAGSLLEKPQEESA